MRRFRRAQEPLWGLTLAIWIQTIVLAITAVIVLWYAIETARLRREMVRQNEIALRPVLVPIFQTGGKPPSFRLKNIGEASAFNIKLEAVPLFPDWKWELTFECPYYLASREEGEVKIIPLLEGKKVSDTGAHSFFPQYARQEKRIKICFSDVEEGRYSLEVTIRPSDFSQIQDVALGPIRKVRS